MVRRPDDLDLVVRAIQLASGWESVADSAAVLAYWIARLHAFGEGNKRTALIAARWVLDHNGMSAIVILPPTDHAFDDLLVRASTGAVVEKEMVALLRSRI